MWEGGAAANGEREAAHAPCVRRGRERREATGDMFRCSVAAAAGAGGLARALRPLSPAPRGRAAAGQSWTGTGVSLPRYGGGRAGGALPVR